jgi:hypothetical protein
MCYNIALGRMNEHDSHWKMHSFKGVCGCDEALVKTVQYSNLNEVLGQS